MNSDFEELLRIFSVDILVSIDGLTFEEAWPSRIQAPLGNQPAWFIGRASGRHIDLHDAESLESSE